MKSCKRVWSGKKGINIQWRRFSGYFITIGTIDNRLGTMIQQALETLLTDIWVHDLQFFRRRASSIKTLSRILELNLGDLNISALILLKLGYFMSFKLIPQI